MNENVDLAKILKNCPKGFKLYSPLFGEVVFEGISGDVYPITLSRTGREALVSFTKEGFYYDNPDTECLLFPSKEQRDWGKFTTPWYKDEKKLVKPKFKVGDKIVNVPMKYWGAPVTQGTILKITDDKYIFTDGSRMSISNQDSWELVSDKKPKFDPKTLKPFDKVLARDYLHGKWTCGFFSHTVIFDNVYMYNIGEVLYKMCIPYNDDTKHLVGTTEEAPEYYKYWED